MEDINTIIKVYTDKNSYKYYTDACKEKGYNTLEYKDYIDFLKKYSKQSVNELLEGNIISLGLKMGTMFIEKCYRLGKSKTPAWDKCERDPNTNKITKMVYRVGGFGCFFKWDKHGTFRKQLIGIRFTPSKGSKGSPHNNRERLAKLLRKNPLQHTKYKVKSYEILIKKVNPSNGNVMEYYDRWKYVARQGYNTANIKKAIDQGTLAYGAKWEVETENRYIGNVGKKENAKTIAKNDLFGISDKRKQELGISFLT